MSFDELGGVRRAFIESHPIRPVSQKIVISDIDLSRSCFHIFTEIRVLCLYEATTEVEFDLGPCALLPSEDRSFAGKVTVNGKKVDYQRRVDENGVGNGVIVSLPRGILNPTSNLLTLCVDVKVTGPVPGVAFIVYRNQEGGPTESSHVYTYHDGSQPSAASWLPCFDATWALALFEIHVQVGSQNSVVASGCHVETRDLSEDIVEYVFHHSAPTTAARVGFAAGCFGVYRNPALDFALFTAPVGTASLLEHTVVQVDCCLHFYKQFLASDFPFVSYTIAFVYDLPCKFISFANLTLVSAEHLHHAKVIDPVEPTRQLLAHAIAEQYFTCFIQPASKEDFWLIKSFAKFLSLLYIEYSFGASEYFYMLYCFMSDVCNFEDSSGGICLATGFFSGPRAWESSVIAKKKGTLVVRMMYDSFGRETFGKLLHRVLSIAKGSDPVLIPNWVYYLMSFKTWKYLVALLTGRLLPDSFDQWVLKSGHAFLEVNYAVNRKRNVIEIKVDQHADGTGRLLYEGPLSIVVQEVDGAFAHTLHIHEKTTHEEVPCHSKGRTRRRRKVMLANGEEADLDWGRVDPHATVLWVRVDPDHVLIRHVVVNQTQMNFLIHHELMVTFEHNVPAQLHALDVFETAASVQTIDVLTDVLLQDTFFFRVKIRALQVLSLLWTKFASNIFHPRPLNIFPDKSTCSQMSGVIRSPLELFQLLYCSKSAPSMLAMNDVTLATRSLQKYAVQQAFVLTLASVRDPVHLCPAEIATFVQDLLFYNDNSRCAYVDDFQRAAFVYALAHTLSTSDETPRGSQDVSASGFIAVTTATLSLDLMKPSYGGVVRSACLSAICTFQELNYLPVDPLFFWPHLELSTTVPAVRIMAVECLARLARRFTLGDQLFNVARLIVVSAEPRFKFGSLQVLLRHAPYFSDHSTPSMRDKCLQVGNFLETAAGDSVHDDRIRLLMTDLAKAVKKAAVPRSPAPREALSLDFAYNPWLHVC